MISLTIDNSTCQIEGLSPGEFKTLREILSYQQTPTYSYYSGSYGGTKRYLIDKKGNFPTGLLYLVEQYLSQKDHSICDMRKRPEAKLGLFTLSLPLTPYPEQTNAVTACLNATRGIICAPTGSGKSLIIALLINVLQVRTLVVVPGLELKNQLQSNLKAVFGSLKNIDVENVDSLDPNKVANYDAVIIDEFHHSGAKTYRTLNKKAWSGIYYKFGFTATPFRSQDHERLLLESVLSKVIYKIDYKTAVDKNYVVPLEAYYIELPKTKTKGVTWAEVYSDLVVNNKERNDLIFRLVSDLHLQGNKTLCLVKEIKHGNAIAREAIGFANGEDDFTKMYISAFNQGKMGVLVGTNGILGEGIDTKPAEFVIIAGLGKSKNAFMQQVGRVMRVFPGKESGKVILFKDPSHKWTKAHFAAQVKILKEEYGVEPQKLDL